MEIYAMASIIALPREDHLQQVYHIFAILGCKHNSVIVFDYTELEIDLSSLHEEDWSSTPCGKCEDKFLAMHPNLEDWDSQYEPLLT